MSAVIEAEPRVVWRALTDPDELCAWDQNLLGPVGPAAGYPCAGTPQRWRYLLRGVQVVLHELPLEVVVERRLHSSLTMGGLKLTQSYTLAPEKGSWTRVSIRMVAENSVPVLGGTIDRFEVRQLVTERVDSLLRALKKWCGARPDAQKRGESSRQPRAGATPTVA